MDMEAQIQLMEHRRIWRKKPILERIYKEEFFSRMLRYRKKDGPCLEVGGGPGFLKQSLPHLISSDVVWCPWLDIVADAQELPLRTGSIANLFGLDVLHHLAVPMLFLEEVKRVLIPGGRLILIEPWITPFSYLIYRYLHQEDCDLSVRPWEKNDASRKIDKKAFDGNQAIPYMLFGPKQLSHTLNSLPDMTPVVIETFSLFAYLLSFGFKPLNLLPEPLYPFISKLEDKTSGLWRRFAALRVLLVMEKCS